MVNKHMFIWNVYYRTYPDFDTFTEIQINVNFSSFYAVRTFVTKEDFLAVKSKQNKEIKNTVLS